MSMHNDEQIVNRIVDMKTRQGEYKEHPDAPGDVTAMLFYVMVDLEHVDEDEHADHMEMNLSGEVHGDQVLYFGLFVDNHLLQINQTYIQLKHENPWLG